jgi:YD repeat-containing protein
MSELADNTKSTQGGGKSAETRPAGDKVDPHVSQQQLGQPNTAPEATSSGPKDKASTAEKTAATPDGTSIETHVSRQQLGTPEALRLVQEAKKPVATPTGLNRVELVGQEKGGSDKQPQPNPEEKRLTSKELQKIAEAIDYAANGGLLGIGTDKDAINEQLKRVRNDKDRQALDEIYKKLAGHGIEDELRDELSGSDLDKALALWKPTNPDAARASVALVEHKEWGLGARSNAAVERDLRDTISTLNSKQIEEMDAAFRKEHNGVGVREALRDDPNLPQETKDALAIYLKGADNRSVADTLTLADIALKKNNLDMFEESFRDASPEARKAFLDKGGAQRILETFGSAYNTGDETSTGETVYLDNASSKQAMDYVTKGKLETATKVELNTGGINDNEEAIELAIEKMTVEERQSYFNGKRLADKPAEGLDPQQQKDRECYKTLRSALEGAGDDRELLKWEDLIACKDGTLVTKLARHGGMIDDGVGEVLRTIEDMDEADWKRLKHDPQQLQRVKDVLAVDLNEHEMQRCNELLKRKLEATSFLDSQAVQRSFSDALGDSVGFFNTDETGVLDSISRMTKTDRELYRSDPEFRKKVDALTIAGMDEGYEQKSAFAQLAAITRGDKPEDDIVSKLFVHADHLNTDEAKVIADVEEAFKKNPKLREQLKGDPAFAASFDEALRAALDPSEYERYGKPLVEKGRISMAVKAELYGGLFNDDEKGVWDTIEKGTPEDFREILADPESVLPFMSKEEREVAINIAQQNGKSLPEDKIRAAMLGAGTTEEAIHEALKGLSENQVEHVTAEYLRKYDSDMLGDTLAEMGGTDREKVVDKAGAQPLDAREAFNKQRDGVYKSVDGVGRWFVNRLDGTGHMTMDELNQYAGGMTKYAQRFEEMPMAERTEFKTNLLKAKELYGKSENSAADLVVDTAIIGAGVIGAKFTGGVSLSLLAYTSFGGALFKIGAKSAIIGNDYDFASADVITDGLTGGIDAATIVLGPAQAAQMLKLGGRSAETAATTLLAQSDEVFKATGKQLLKEGAETKLQQRLAEEVAVAISNGAETVDQKAIARVAKEFAASPEDVAKVTAMVQDNLGKAIATEGGNALKAQMRELALNSAAGNVGGGLSGFVYGLKDIDESRSLSLNFYQLGQSAFTGGMFGTGMAGGFTLGLKGVGKGLNALRGIDAKPHINAGPVAELPHINPGAVAESPPQVHSAPQAEAPRFETASTEPSQVSLKDHPDGNALADDYMLHPVGEAPGAPLSLLDAAETSAVGADGAVLKAGDVVLLDGSPAKLHSFDTRTGEAIVHLPERKEWVVEFRPFDNADGRYKPITINGEEFYRDELGRVYDVFETGSVKKIAVNHQYQLRSPDKLEAAPAAKKQLYLFGEEAREIDDKAARAGELPPPLPRRDAPRVEAPEIPTAPWRAGLKTYHDSNLYDGAVLTLDGKQLGAQLRPDGQPIEIGRGALGLDYTGEYKKVSGKHATLQWDPAEQMYYVEEHSLNGSYLKRAGDETFTSLPGGKEKPYKVYLGPNDSIRLGSQEGPEIKLRVDGGDKLKPPPGPKGDVDVRIFFDGEPLQPNADGELLIGRRHQTFGNESPSDILNRRVAREHASLKWDEGAQKWRITDLTEASPKAEGQEFKTIQVLPDGNGTFIRRENGKVEFLQGQSALLGPNDQIHLGSPDGPKLEFITNQGQRQADGRVIVPRKNFDTAVKRPDGTTEITNFLHYKRLEDPQGKVLHTLTPEGVRTGFTYDADNRLATIKFDDNSVASRGADGKWTRTTSDGKTEPFWEGKIDVDPDGSIRFTDKGHPPRATVERVDGVREVHHPNGRVEYQNVDFARELGAMNKISSSFTDKDQLLRFKTMMNTFEQRANAAGLSKQEQAETFFHIRRMISAEYGAFLTAPERMKLAEQVINQAGNPRICQGANNTCNVGTVEARMFERKPSEAARLISDVVITGRYVTADGTTVDLGRIPGVLKPDKESGQLARLFKPDNSDLSIDGKRPFASQIFETAAVNVKYAHENKSLRPGEMVVYEKPGTGPKTSKTGEELAKYSVDNMGVLRREVIETNPNIYAHELTDIYNRIAGTSDRNFVLYHSSGHGPKPNGSYGVTTAKELQEAIERIRKDGEGPAILMVHTGKEPFWTDSGEAKAGGSGGWHVINVHNVRRDPKTGQTMVEFTNQWGSKANHMGDKAVPLDQLFEATMPPVPRDGSAVKGMSVIDAAAARETDDLLRAAQIVGDHDPKGGLWWPTRHFDELTHEDRSVLFEMLNGRESPLTDPEFTHNFAERAIPTFQTWTENYKPLFKEMKEAQDTVLEYRSQITEMINQLPEADYRDLENNKALLLDYFQDDHRKLNAINSFFDARQKNFELHDRLDRALEPRRKQLEDLANGIVANFRTADGSLSGIPPVKVELVSPQYMGSAVATYGDGVLRINQAELLNNKSVADLLGTVYHELTHNEQQTTILRALADELKIGAKATPDQMTALRALYRERTGGGVSDRYAGQVLDLRNGAALPENAATRARDLIDAFNLNRPVGEEWKELGNSFRRIQREIPRLEGTVEEKSVAARILESLSGKSRDQLALRYFGTRTVPPELDKYITGLRRFMNGNDDSWNHKMELEARQVILRLMRENMDSINDRRRVLYENYMQFHEYDAWLSGERMRRSAIANNATFRDPKNSLWEEIDWLQ